MDEQCVCVSADSELAASLSGIAAGLYAATTQRCTTFRQSALGCSTGCTSGVCVCVCATWSVFYGDRHARRANDELDTVRTNTTNGTLKWLSTLSVLPTRWYKATYKATVQSVQNEPKDFLARRPNRLAPGFLTLTSHFWQVPCTSN